MTDREILYHEDDGIHHIILNRPEKRNALSISMLDAISSYIVKINASEISKAIIISSNGSIFSAGADLHQMKSHPQEMTSALLNLVDVLEKNQLPINVVIENDVFAGAHILITSAHSAMVLKDVHFTLP